MSLYKNRMNLFLLQKGAAMGKLFEYIDTLNTPFEAFTTSKDNFYPVRPHWHYYMELIIMLKGKITVECNGQNYVVSKGDIFVFCPKAIHSITAGRCEDFEYGVMKFDIGKLNVPGTTTPSLRQLFEGAQTSISPALYFPKGNTDFRKMYELFESCKKEIETPSFGYDLVLHSTICLFLMELVRVLRNEGFNTDAAVTGSTGYVTVDTISEYIDLHSSDHLSANDLADMCGMSYSYFAKSFKQIYGRSCKEYIEFVRVSKAEDLLLFTDFDLTYISQETGFSDCSHLIKVFKKWKGETPKQYRIKKKSR